MIVSSRVERIEVKPATAPSTKAGAIAWAIACDKPVRRKRLEHCAQPGNDYGAELKRDRRHADGEIQADLPFIGAQAAA